MTTPKITPEIEKIARSLIERIGSPWPYEKMDPAVKALWHGHATAAIEALMPPSPAMVEASKRVCAEALAGLGVDTTKITSLVYTGDKEFTAMLNRALGKDNA